MGNDNEKSELMLMKHVRAHGSSCSQVTLIYLHTFCRNLLLQPKITKNHLKSIF